MKKSYIWIAAAALLGMAQAAQADDAAAAAKPASTNATATALAPPQPPPKWVGSASLGMTLQGGNTRNFAISGDIEATRKWDHNKNELNLRLDGTYGESDGVENANQLRGYAQYNRLFSEKLFGFGRAEGLYDPIADVNYRFIVSGGAGYYFIKNADTQLRGEIGPGVVFENQGGIESTYATLRLAERWDQKIGSTSKLWQTLEYLPQVDDWGNYIVNAEIGIETILSKKLTQRTFVQDTYHSEPAAGRVKNDIKLVVAFGYKF